MKRLHTAGFVALLTIVAALAGCAKAYHVGGITVEPTGGAGFAGLRTADVLEEPAIRVASGCTAHCAATVIADSVDLVPNQHYEWRPALSTGVAFQHYAASGVGGGIGLNVVLVPGAKGQTAPWPALTVHAGSATVGFFAGLILSPTNGVSLPAGVSSLRVARGAVPDLVTQNTGQARHLYFGMRLGGKSDSSGVP